MKQLLAGVALRLRWLPLVVALAALAPFSPAAAQSADPAWRTYEDPDGRFAIEFPRGWTVGRDPFQILVATAPRESSDDPFQETIKIVATDVAPGITLDHYYRNSLEVYRSIWKVHGAADGSVAGVRARRVVIDQTIGRLKSRLLKCFVIGRGRVFVITLASEPLAFDRQLPVFEAVLSTFKPAAAPLVPPHHAKM